MTTDTALLDRFHAVLVDEIRAQRPDLLSAPFTVAEIYQELVPYRTHRDRIGVEMNGDYEHLLVRLLAGEGGYLVLDADAAREDLRKELKSPHPNTGLFREYAAADVRLNPERVPESGGEGMPRDEAVTVESLAPSDGSVEAALELSDGGPGGPGPQGAADAGVEAGGEDPAAAAGAAVANGATAEEDADVCSWCRATLPHRENLNYCPFCGTDVNVVPCPSCGEALESEWRFCIACGAEAASD